MSCNDTPSGLITKAEKFSYIEAKKADIQTLCADSISGGAAQYAIVSMTTVSPGSTDWSQAYGGATDVQILGTNGTGTTPFWGNIQGDLGVTIADDPSGVVGDGGVIVIPEAGRYDVEFWVFQLGLSVGAGNILVELIDQNGTRFSGPVWRESARDTQYHLRGIVDLPAGGTIRVRVTQDSGAADDLEVYQDAQMTIRRV